MKNSYKKGDIIMVRFPYLDKLKEQEDKLVVISSLEKSNKESKTRPSLVLIEKEEYITVCYVTTKLPIKESEDFELKPNVTNKLEHRSIVKISKIISIDKQHVVKKIGKLNPNEIEKLNSGLKKILHL